jgi:hypothetical protein
MSFSPRSLAIGIVLPLNLLIKITLAGGPLFFVNSLQLQ